MVEKLKLLADCVYKISTALIYIVDMECCDYGQSEAVDMAEKYIEEYEKDHPEVKNEQNLLQRI